MNTGSAFRYLVGTLVTLAVCLTAALAEPMPVSVGIEPLAAIVAGVGGELIVVNVLLPGGGDPHTFSPTPKQIMRLSESNIYITAGLPFETRLCEKLADHGALQIIYADAGIQKRSGECGHVAETADLAEAAETADAADTVEAGNAGNAAHQHGPACQHGYHNHETGEGDDPHIWLSIVLIQKMATNIAGDLIRIDPEHEAQYRENLIRFVAETEAADDRIQNLLHPYEGKSFYVFHPAFTYFARDYGLTEIAVEVEGKLPAPKQLGALTAEMREAGVNTIFVQPQFDQRSASTIARAIDGNVVVLDPMARDLLSNLERTAVAVATSFMNR